MLRIIMWGIKRSLILDKKKRYLINLEASSCIDFKLPTTTLWSNKRVQSCYLIRLMKKRAHVVKKVDKGHEEKNSVFMKVG